MTKNISIKFLTAMLLGLAFLAGQLMAQVTTSELTGRVVDGSGNPVAGVTIEATHVPTGTTYTATTNDSGRYTIPLMRVGGPYTVKATQAGFKEQTQENIVLSLGVSGTANFNLSSAIQETVNVAIDDSFSETKTGAATSVSSEVVSTLPTLGRNLVSYAKLTPQTGPGNSFGGQDNRFNNVTVDGSFFNNSFGLGQNSGAPGDRTGVSPISMDAIQEFQVNISPYDVKQGNFVGAGINTITKSGSNKYAGSVYYNWQKPGLVGRKAGANAYNPGSFDFHLWGFTAGGPLPFFNFGENDHGFISGKNKLFFFFSYESELSTRPQHTFTALQPGQVQGGNITRVLASDLEGLSSFLKTNFGYETGPYQNYDSVTPGKKYLPRVDWNINDTNRLMVRYMQLDSSSPSIMSGSGAFGVGGSTATGSNFLSFQNTNYKILENIRSIIGEWTSSYGGSAANSLIVGYNQSDESRPQEQKLFPLVDILKGGTQYTAFGYEPFTPSNTLRYHSYQIQDNLTFFKGPHTFDAGVSYEKYHSLNIFFPESQSVYIYNSLDDFYTDANGYLANPNRTTSPVTLAKFEVEYSNIPGQSEPVQPLDVTYMGFYGQDHWKINDKFSLSYGLRIDVPFFGNNGFVNPVVNALTFKDETGQSVQYKTEKLPDSNILWAPRVGFNWSPLSSRKLIARGGTGIFTARPPYVWISNQIGNNGVLTGLDSFTSTTTRPFNPDPNHYKPASVTGAPAGSQQINVTDPSYRFPQIWRSSLGVDYKLPWNLVAGVEYIYSRNVNNTYYINANLSSPNSSFSGPDSRPRWTSASVNRINPNIVYAIVLKNENKGYGQNLAFTLEHQTTHGLYFKTAYSYGLTKNYIDAATTASTSWGSDEFNTGDPNNPQLSNSAYSQGKRFFATASYHIDYFHFGGTTISTFWDTEPAGVALWRVGNDLNGDGQSNDLIYIPKDQSEMSFVQNGTFSPADQAAAWDAFINQDKYLSKHRGQYAYRNGEFLPFLTRVDLSVAQDVHVKWGKTTHKFQFRADVLNFGNLLNKNWGVGYTSGTGNGFIGNSLTMAPLTYNGTLDAQGRPQYKLATFGGHLIDTSFVRSAGTSDVYRVQFGVRYVFN